MFIVVAQTFHGKWESQPLATIEEAQALIDIMQPDYPYTNFWIK